MTSFNVMQKLLEQMQAAAVASSESEETLEVPLISFDGSYDKARARSETIRTLTADDVRSHILSGTDWTKEECIPFQLMFETEEAITRLAKNGGAIRPLAQFLERVRLAGSPTSTTQSGAENPFVAAAMQGPEWVLQDNQFGSQREALPIAILLSYIYCQLRSQITARLWNGIPITHVTTWAHNVARTSVHDNVFVSVWKYAQTTSLVRVLAPEEYGRRHGAWPQNIEAHGEDALYCWMIESVISAMNQVIVSFVATMKSTARKLLAQFSVFSGDANVCIDMDRVAQTEARKIYSKLGLESLWHIENSKPVPQSTYLVSSFTTKLIGETKQALVNMYTSPCIEMIFLEGCRFWGHDTIFDANKTALALPSSTIVFAAAMVDRLILAGCRSVATGIPLVERDTLTTDMSLAWKVHQAVITSLVYEHRPPTKDGRATPSRLGLFLARIIKRLDIPSQSTMPGPPTTTLSRHEMLFHLSAMLSFGAAPVAAQVPDLLDALVAAGAATNDDEDHAEGPAASAALF